MRSGFTGNTVQVCPVGALTSTQYRFRSRPFDLVSVPTVCEHCSSGCGLRTDVRRSTVMRRLAWDTPEVNEEWNCDKGRFAFSYLTEGRVSAPLVREDGVLREGMQQLAEVWRGCVEAIPRGQWEASSSLAMGYFQQMRHVVLPQAVRLSIAPTVGFSVQIVKGTAVASIIGFEDLSKLGSVLANATFQPFLIYGLVALAYFALCWPLSLCASHLEKKLYAAR